MKLSKIALFTDIHFGRRGNSKVHNQDCLDYITWFCDNVKRDASLSHVGFLGDWFESRSAINIETLEYSYRGMKLLGDLKLPTFFVVGNHDLHRRTTRDIFSTRIFNEIPGVTVIDKVTVVDNCVFSPFLFDQEYEGMLQHNDKHAWFGHFEFKNFVITGYNTIMDHGPDHKLFSGPKRIFSGHFHKRQCMDNVVYVGNTFPMDMGDADDNARGMATYDIMADSVKFTDWDDCPKFTKVKLSDVIAEKWKPAPKMRVKCVVDIDIGYTEAQELREALITAHDLRDLVLEEDREAKQGLIEGDTTKVTEVHDMKFDSIDELVTSQLEAAITDSTTKGKYDVQLLLDIYKGLNIESTDKDVTT